MPPWWGHGVHSAQNAQRLTGQGWVQHPARRPRTALGQQPHAPPQILQPATTNMLQRIGDSLKGQKWLAYLVLGALALVFAAWGAYGVVNLSFGGAHFASEAEGSKIPLPGGRQATAR